MQNRRFTALALAMMSAAVPAQACRINVPLRLDDVRQADAVVVGRITDYRVVRNRFGYPARFNLVVEEVLTGRPRRILHVNWINSTYPLPAAMRTGRYLVAIRDPSHGPSTHGPGTTLFPIRESDAVTVLQAACSSAFIFENRSAEARAIRGILD